MSSEVFEISISSSYRYFFIQIYDGPNAASKLIGTYCSSEQLIQMESTSHTVFIRLVTDVSNQGRGFELKFNASKKYILFKLEEKKNSCQTMDTK